MQRQLGAGEADWNGMTRPMSGSIRSRIGTYITICHDGLVDGGRWTSMIPCGVAGTDGGWTDRFPVLSESKRHIFWKVFRRPHTPLIALLPPTIFPQSDQSSSRLCVYGRCLARPSRLIQSLTTPVSIPALRSFRCPSICSIYTCHIQFCTSLSG
jgi:hypothetical protein